jgi:hypothetical protein
MELAIENAKESNMVEDISIFEIENEFIIEERERTKRELIERENLLK